MDNNNNNDNNDPIINYSYTVHQALLELAASRDIVLEWAQDSTTMYYRTVDNPNTVTKIDMHQQTNLDPTTLLSIILGTREPLALYSMSRVVGYFSRISNWNKSKIGELKDRQSGNYGVPA